jgi:hypothetical protein
MHYDELKEGQHQQEQKINDTKPALLSKSELQWLLGDIKVSKSFEYKIRSSIKRKVQTLTELELPLLIKNNFFVNSYYEIDDDGLGLDLEPGPPQSLSLNSTLVRQRSRDRIPAKASLFCKKEEESGFLTLQSVVTPLQPAVMVKLFGIKPLSISKGNSNSLRV